LTTLILFSSDMLRKQSVRRIACGFFPLANAPQECQLPPLNRYLYLIADRERGLRRAPVSFR
jgi:hypothetical protein